MGEARGWEGRAVQRHASNIDVFLTRIFRLDGKLMAILQVEYDTPERGRAQLIIRCGWANRIEPDGRKDIPCRHLPSVIVARETAGCVVVFRLQDVAHPFLRQVGPSCGIQEVGYLVAGLVTMPVATLGEHTVKT